MWLKLDDAFARHRKVRGLSDGAFRLHVTAMCQVAADKSDGLITGNDVAQLTHGRRLRRHIPALVEAGLWEPVLGGAWVLHDFLDYNPSRAEQEAAAESNAKRVREWRRRRRESDDADEQSGRSGPRRVSA